MTSVLFADDWVAALALGVVCYAGVVLYGSLLASVEIDVPLVRTIRLGLAIAVLYYLGQFPLPEPHVRLVQLQTAASFLAGGGLGPVLLAISLRSYRELRAYERGAPLRPLGALVQGLLYAPGVLALGLGLADRMRLIASYRTVPAPEDIPFFTPGIAIFNVVGLAYIAGAGLLGLAAMRAWRGIRMSEPIRRLLRFMVVLALTATAFWIALLVSRRPSGVQRYAIIPFSALWLAPGLIFSRVAYDAVLRRVVGFHLLAAAGAAVVLGGSALAGWLDLAPAVAWALGLAVLAVGAAALPARLDRAIERWLFPRAGALREQLAEVAAGPLAAATRAEAGADLLREVVESVECEGGAIVLQPTALERAAIRVAGDVDPSVCGATADEAAAYLAGLAPRGAPRHLDILPLADRLKLARGNVELVCPLAAGRTEATLLLGRRRGWLYDVGTQQALRRFSSQAGLALENLTLVTARIAAERSLGHAEKLAALGEMAARITHEIRNPVTAARSLAQQLAREPGSPFRTEHGLIQEELERVERQVAALLRFARRDELHLGPVDVGALVRATAAELRARLEAAAIEVEVEAADGVLARADREKLRQVLINLIENAMDALGAVGGRRRLALAVGGENGTATVRVSDSGPGVPADALPRLFEPFFSLKDHGTGLGLAIARRTVEAHGGRLTAESRSGAGMTFRIELPLAGGEE
jgi:signal transduction histidine kinase